MNRDDIIRMYEKANGWSPKGFENTIDDLERFAALVAAAEREECAKVAQSFDPHMRWSNYGRVIANKIRERGQ
jgi:hypothetical protein